MRIELKFIIALIIGIIVVCSVFAVYSQPYGNPKPPVNVTTKPLPPIVEEVVSPKAKVRLFKQGLDTSGVDRPTVTLEDVHPSDWRKLVNTRGISPGIAKKVKALGIDVMDFLWVDPPGISSGRKMIILPGMYSSVFVCEGTYEDPYCYIIDNNPPAPFYMIKDGQTWIVMAHFSGAGGGDPTLWKSQTQNKTYLCDNESIALSAAVKTEGWGIDANFSTVTGLNSPQGLDTNMSSWTQDCCIIAYDYDTDAIVLYNRTGTNVSRITPSPAMTNARGLWINASDESITDIWIIGDTEDAIWHLKADGTMSDDATGNFSVSGCDGSAQGLTSNITSGAPTRFWVVGDATNKICEYNMTGTIMTTYDLPAVANSPWDITTNETNVVPYYFMITDYTDDEVYLVTTDNTTVANFDTAGDSWTSPRGLTVLKRSGYWNETILGDGDATSIGRWVIPSLDTAWFSSNETGAWINMSAYGSPFDVNETQAWENVNLTWHNESVYPLANVSWRIYVNNTIGKENATSVRWFKVRGYVNGTSYNTGNITNVSCVSDRNITLTMAATPAGHIELLMPFIVQDTTQSCGYESSEGTRIRVVNTSTHCYVKVNHSALLTGTLIKIVPSVALRLAKPSNLPGALAAAAVGLMIVIYVIVTTEED